MKKFLIIAVVLLIVGYGVFYMTKSDSKELVSPSFNEVKNQKVASPTPIPSVVPKTFQFDGNTDLKAELEKVNPSVSEEDFVD